MKRKDSTVYTVLFSLLMGIMLLAACTQTSRVNINNAPANVTSNTTIVNTNTTVNNTIVNNINPTTNVTTNVNEQGAGQTQGQSDQAPDNTISLGQIYNFAQVRSFEYRLLSNATNESGPMTFQYTITQDAVLGKPAWVQTTQTNSAAGVIVTKVWLDKATYQCLKMTTSYNINGQLMENNVECPSSGPNAAENNQAMVNLTYLGTEQITVPAGTFNAKKYAYQDINYWYSPAVPVPLKIVYLNDSAVMELVSYS